MDTTSGTEFHPSSLSLVKGKWYVVVTKPTALVNGSSKQVRRSTGTTDKRVATTKQHEITAAIYASFREALIPPPETLKDILREHWVAQELSEAQITENVGFLNSTKISNAAACVTAWHETGENTGFVEKVVKHLSYKEALLFRKWVTPDADPYVPKKEPAEPIQNPVVEKAETTKQVPTESLKSIVDNYIECREWNRDKTRNQSQRYIKGFMDKVSVTDVQDIAKQHAYRYAKALAKEGMANKTIKSAISAVSAFLTYCEREELIEASPFTDLKLSSYGKKVENYRPFTKSELHALFNQRMPDADRLALSILLATGMRLDEVALLEWDQIKQHEDGFKYIDLTGAKVKNQGSERLVPLHPSIRIKSGNVGRLFSYYINNDGKAEAPASKALMKHVRGISSDRRLVLHSLRGSFKDMLRDAGVSKEINDFITGHDQGDTAGNYGSGPSVSVRYDAVKDLDLSFMSSSNA